MYLDMALVGGLCAVYPSKVRIHSKAVTFRLKITFEGFESFFYTV